MSPRRILHVLIAAVLAALALPAASAHAASGALRPTPAGAIPGRYVVVLKAGADVTAEAAQARAKGATVTYTYTHALRGYAVKASARVARKLAADPQVASVTQDAAVHTTAVEPVPAPPDTYWGLDRIDQRTLPVNHAYSYNIGASDVHAYVIDTGIQTSHSQFGGRASVGVDTIGGTGQDCNGHGTHVSGTIGGATYGVAKAVRLVAVRVLDCGGSGTYAGVIAGVDWVTAHAVKPAVANMSLGGGSFLPLDIAVDASINSGVTYSLAAGNNAGDACATSPAETLSAITVGATGTYETPATPVSDARSSFSNYGGCLDLFAPGSHIKSAWLAGGVNTISGTSMAAPHVTGVAALWASVFPGQNPMWIRNQIVNNATPGVVTGPGAGSPNKLLFTVQRRVSRLTIAASPNPVRRGGAVRTSGRLTVGATGLAGQRISLWFDPVGTPPAVRKAIVATNGTGNYATSLVQNVSGTWIVTYAGQPLILPATARIYVRAY